MNRLAAISSKRSSRPPLRLWPEHALLIVSIAALTLTAACSDMGGSAINIAYDHADWLAAHKVARYVDLDKPQTVALRAALDHLHAWHRSHELPVYAALLDQAAERMRRPLERGDIAWMMQEIDERRRVGAIQAVDELGPVFLTLTREQKTQLADSLARDNAHFIKTHLVADGNKQVHERTDWLAAHVERWIGDLTPAQRARVNAVAVATPDYPAARAAERRRRQLRFVQLMEQQHDEQTLRMPLIALLATPRLSAGVAYRSAAERYEAELTQMVLDLDRMLSPQQRTTAISRLHRYATQARTLAAKPR